MQYTARDVTSGMLYMGFADERSLTYATLFADYLNKRLLRHGADLSRTVRQTDNGTEYILFFNLVRPNTYKENQTPWQIVSKKQPNLSVEIVKIPPVFLGDLFPDKSKVPEDIIN